MFKDDQEQIGFDGENETDGKKKKKKIVNKRESGDFSSVDLDNERMPS